MFVVSDGMETFFTRDGSFYVDGAGNLAMSSTGYNVMGWGVDEKTGDIHKDTVSALRIMSAANMTYPPEATSQAYISGILDKNDSDVTSANGKVVNLNFYDSLGYTYTAKITFKQSDITNQYSVELSGLLDSAGKEVDISAMTEGDVLRYQESVTSVHLDATAYKWDGNVLKSAVADENGEYATIADLADIFNADGSLKETEEAQAGLDAIAKAYGYEGSTEDFLALCNEEVAADGTSNYVTIQNMLANMVSGGGGTLFPTDVNSFELAGRVFRGANVTYNGSTGEFASINGNTTGTNFTLNFSKLGGNFSDVVLDLSETSMFDNKGTSTIGATSGDLDGLGAGRRLGEMIGVSIQNNGMIYATYDNGMTKLLGQIATAEFANASGLEKKGDNLYAATLNSGDFDGIGVDVTASGGYMSTGQLEMSNVDLSAEFTEMITTQRGFQANSRIITVSDTLLEELTNLKR